MRDAVSLVSVTSRLTLSAVAIKYSAEFPASVLPFDRDTYERLRRSRDVFVHRRTFGPLEGKLLVVPLSPNAAAFPATQMLQTHENLALVAALLEEQLPKLLSQLELSRDGHAYDHVRRDDDLLARALERAGLKESGALELFHSYVNVRLSVRYEYLSGYGSLVLMPIDLHRTYTCDATAADFLQRGEDLTGIGIIDRADGRFLGIAREASDTRLVVNGSRGELTRHPNECRLSATSTTLAKLLERRWSPADIERWRAADKAVEASTLAGPGHLQLLRELASDFTKRGTQTVVPSLTMSFERLITPPPLMLPPILYSFSSEGDSHAAQPVAGIEQHGPRDAGRFTQPPRVAFVFPEERRIAVKMLASALFDGTEGYSGMIDIFRLPPLNQSYHPVKRGTVATDHYLEVIKTLGDAPDLVFVIVEEEDAESRDPAYAAVMAALAQRRVPAHQVRTSKLETTGERTRFVLEDIGIAAYVKLGGSPWVLNSPSNASDLVIGLGYTTPRGSEAKKRYRAIATAFAADGRFLGSAYSSLRSKDEHADAVEFVLGTVVEAVSSREANARVAVHTWPVLTEDATSAVARALDKNGRALLTVRVDHPFRLFDDDEPACVPARGTVADFGRIRTMLSVHGEALLDHERREHPSPLLIEISDVSTLHDLRALTEQLYQLTGMYGGAMHMLREPATLYYARLIAKQLTRLDSMRRSHGMPSETFTTIPWFL